MVHLISDRGRNDGGPIDDVPSVLVIGFKTDAQAMADCACILRGRKEEQRRNFSAQRLGLVGLYYT
jgi:hypothetical protein